MSEFIKRIWLDADAYDNPTIWTDGPTPDFPAALLVRVPSNAGLFDWITSEPERIAAAKAEVIELLAARLELMADERDAPDDEWAEGFDGGWESAILQVNDSILKPSVEAHVRSNARRFRSVNEADR